jgi:hypothetical protein
MQSLDGRQNMDNFRVDPSEFTKTNLQLINIFRRVTVPISSFPTLCGHLAVLKVHLMGRIVLAKS